MAINLKNNFLFILFLVLYLFCHILIWSIQLYINDDKEFFEITRQNNQEFSIPYASISKLNNMLDSELLILAESTMELSHSSITKIVPVKGVYGDFNSFFSRNVDEGRFLDLRWGESTDEIVLFSETARDFFNNENVVGNKLGKDMVVGVYNNRMFDVFIPSQFAYVPLDKILVNGHVKMEAIYINKITSSGRSVDQSYIVDVLSNFNISPESYNIIEFSDEVQHVKTVKYLIIIFIILLMIIDIKKRIKASFRYFSDKEVRYKDKQDKIRQMIYTIMFICIQFFVIVYLVIAFDLSQVSFDNILNEEIITLEHYKTLFRCFLSDLFGTSNNYMTYARYYVQVVGKIITFSYTICMILLIANTFQTNKQFRGEAQRHVWPGALFIWLIFLVTVAYLNHKLSINFMLPFYEIVALLAMLIREEIKVSNNLVTSLQIRY